MSCGHRIEGLPGPGAKCANIHGHTFGIAWTFAVESEGAEEIEFAAVKKALRSWVDEHLDHGFIVYSGDPLRGTLEELNTKVYAVPQWPTTEVIARLLGLKTPPPYFQHLKSVTVTEGPHNEAKWVR